MLVVRGHCRPEALDGTGTRTGQTALHRACEGSPACNQYSLDGPRAAIVMKLLECVLGPMHVHVCCVFSGFRQIDRWSPFLWSVYRIVVLPRPLPHFIYMPTNVFVWSYCDPTTGTTLIQVCLGRPMVPRHSMSQQKIATRVLSGYCSPAPEPRCIHACTLHACMHVCLQFLVAQDTNKIGDNLCSGFPFYSSLFTNLNACCVGLM